MQVQVVREGERGCGFRSSDAFYLRGEYTPSPCGKVPIPLVVCPCCGEGVRQVRGWRKVDLAKLADGRFCGRADGCSEGCPFGGMVSDAFLLWIGKKFYTPESFNHEALKMGISKRIASTSTGNPSMPKDFELGVSWVALAHPEVPYNEEGKSTTIAGIFSAFRPQRIEYAVMGEMMNDGDYLQRLERLEEQGVDLVRVEPAPELQLEACLTVTDQVSGRNGYPQLELI